MDMASTAPVPYDEAMVQVRTRPNADAEWSDWRNSLDLDPVIIPVEIADPQTHMSYSTDVFDGRVLAIMDSLVEMESDMMEHRLVWSLTGRIVRGTCPVCDDDFNVSEGAPGDELNEGYNAVWCGCDPADA